MTGKTQKLFHWLLLPSLVLTLIVGVFTFAAFSTVQAESDCDLECNLEEMNAEEYDECQAKKNSCLQKQIKEYKDKIDSLQNQAQTLKGAINLINGQIELQELQIRHTQYEIYQLEKEISELSERIEGLSLSLDSLTSMLIRRVQASYKQYRTSPLIALFTTDHFSSFISQYKYLQQAEKQTAKAMEEAENQRLLYDEQKTLKQVKQQALEEKRQQLQGQQAELERQKQSKEKLLAETNNDEATYQRLLAEAQREVASLKRYVTSQIGTAYCLSGPAPQPDGWFYSQRDSRWCNQLIGNSNETIGAVGCLISSTAMIWQKHGHKIDPPTIASNPNNFWLNTAYMKNPLPSPPGYKYTRYDYRDLDLIDQELDKDRPVIVHLNMGGPGHFVVLKKGEDGDYIMNDPVFGPNLAFDKHYSVSMIDSIRTFTPS
jgi:peptidoglycan hydrolase CwlO-like protein